jgi:hypothetical protein
MWSYDATITAGARVTHVAITTDGRPLTFSEVLARLQSEAAFRDYLTGLLASAPYPAFRWETPAISTGKATRPFEFVMVDDPGLERHPDPGTFAGYFRRPGAGDVIATDNLTRTATLVVPRRLAGPDAYAHLGRFVRRAPPAQVHALWQCLGASAAQRLSPRPQWISTAGAGIAWLHVRIDDAPKYYAHRPYAVSD